jgi:hypothetical protein
MLCDNITHSPADCIGNAKALQAKLKKDLYGCDVVFSLGYGWELPQMREDRHLSVARRKSF